MNRLSYPILPRANRRPSAPGRPRRWLSLLPALLLPLFLAGCDYGLPPTRVVPAEMPAAERAAHRKLPLRGAENFRDLGGYRTEDGRQLRWGLIYRADDLSELNRGDLHYLERLGLKQAVDFRSQAEREEEPDRLPKNVRAVLRPIAVGPGNMDFKEMFSNPENLQNFDGVQWMQEVNRQLVREYTPVYREWLRELAWEEATPQVFHCTAGKDRTGFGAAMLLAALGVPKETIMQDYLLSQAYSEELIKNTLARVRIVSLFQIDPEVLRPILGVEASYLEAAYSEIEKEYGSLQAYLERGLGIDRETKRRLQEKFLEPAS